MKRRLLIMTVALAAIHLVLTFGLVLVAIGSGMDAFDNPGARPSPVERVADSLAGILVQPGKVLWTPWMSRNLPDVFEWAGFVLNSLPWGTVLALALNAPGFLKGRQPGHRIPE